MFIIAGVSIGVGVIVFMSAMLTGLQANFIKRVLTSQAHIQLIPPDETARPLRAASGIIGAATVQRPTQRLRSIDQWQKVRLLLQQWPEITNVSPSVSASALAVRGAASRSISLTGIDPDVYLDSKSADTVFSMMRKVNVDQCTTFLIVTHNMELADAATASSKSWTGAWRAVGGDRLGGHAVVMRLAQS